ncbi:hypothetical protein ABT095_08220 [Kitasatospora sp. NPDC002227]|uniref:hypothetical protein n=1 Tax=Kitasatospora sp. NPDC002227 TaxID=3154773 RepID=UPI003326D8D9
MDTSADLFDELFTQVRTAAGRFGHREHLELAWLAVRRVGLREAVALVAEGIRRTATAAGAPEKFHATMTRAWVELVARHADAPDFDTVLAAHPELLDQQLLHRHYTPETLASPGARAYWVEPDLAPLPGRTPRV